MKLLVSKLEPDAEYPVRNHKYDAGLDLKSYYDYILRKNETRVVRTGVAILIPVGYMGLIMPKSRSDYLIGGGVVDAGYTGEIKVKVVNTSERTIAIAYGDDVAQLVVVPIETPEIQHVNEQALARVGKEISDRGSQGGINKPWDGRRGF
jgi:dUTP pyrophosphatase